MRKKRLRQLFKAQKGVCYLCGGQMTLELNHPNTAEIEHIVPKAQKIQGNLTSVFNKAAAGAACNRYKADKPLHLVINELRKLKLCECE